ncbi:MAG: hypothetical protein AAGD43_28070 [Pseudomonadota bacterium]
MRNDQVMLGIDGTLHVTTDDTGMPAGDLRHAGRMPPAWEGASGSVSEDWLAPVRSISAWTSASRLLTQSAITAQF